MKKLALFLVALFVAVAMTAQPPKNTATDLHLKAEKFLKERTIPFDSSQTPQVIPDMEGFLKTIKASKINYTCTEYQFLGSDVEECRWTSTSCQSRGGGIAKPFVKYSIEQRNGITYLTEVYGNDYW